MKTFFKKLILIIIFQIINLPGIGHCFVDPEEQYRNVPMIYLDSFISTISEPVAKDPIENSASVLASYKVNCEINKKKKIKTINFNDTQGRTGTKLFFNQKGRMTGCNLYNGEFERVYKYNSADNVAEAITLKNGIKKHHEIYQYDINGRLVEVNAGWPLRFKYNKEGRLVTISSFKPVKNAVAADDMIDNNSVTEIKNFKYDRYGNCIEFTHFSNTYGRRRVDYETYEIEYRKQYADADTVNFSDYSAVKSKTFYRDGLKISKCEYNENGSVFVSLLYDNIGGIKGKNFFVYDSFGRQLSGEKYIKDLNSDKLVLSQKISFKYSGDDLEYRHEQEFDSKGAVIFDSELKTLADGTKMETQARKIMSGAFRKINSKFDKNGFMVRRDDKYTGTTDVYVYEFYK